MTIARALSIGLVLLTACSDSADKAPSAEDWIRLEGATGKTIWAYATDHASRPLIAINGEVRRYTDADGWKTVGTTKVPNGTPNGFRRGPGHMWVTSSDGYYDLPEGSDTWTRIVKNEKTFSSGTTIAPNGDLYLRAGSAVEYWDQSAQTWSTVLSGADFASPATFYVASDNSLYFTGGAGIYHAGRGGTSPVRVYDCNTKLALQCGSTPEPFADDSSGTIYFWQVNNLEGLNRIYKMAPGATDLTFVGQTNPPLIYQAQAHVLADGTVYLGGRQRSNAYDFGEVFVFKNGKTEGTSFGRPPGEISVAPDGTFYAFAGGDGRAYRLKR